MQKTPDGAGLVLTHGIRPCKKCGKMHAMVRENIETGETTPIDFCSFCMFEFLPPKKTDAED